MHHMMAAALMANETMDGLIYQIYLIEIWLAKDK